MTRLPLCFICGKEVALADRMVVQGADHREHLIRLHRNCAPYLAANALAGLSTGALSEPQHHMRRRDAERLGLTDLEQRALELLAAGHTNAEIAGELGISVKSARNAVGEILSKLDASNRTEAVFIAVREGLLE